MSFNRGWAAINLEMTDQVPRTEYSADFHWPLVSSVTGQHVDEHSPDSVKSEASNAFVRAWDYDFWWNICVTADIFGDKRTKMGHAVYQAGGVDFSEERSTFLEDPEDVYALDLYEVYGERNQAELIRMFSENYQKLCARRPECVNMTGVYVTLMSGLIDLLGWDMLLLAAGTDPKAFGAFTNRYADWISQYFSALAKSDAPVVMIHDDFVWANGKFMRDEFYQTYVFPNYKKMWAPLNEAGKKIMFTADGDYSEYIDAVANCGVNGFVMEPMTDMNHIAEKYGKTHAFVGNVDTRILLSGTRDDIRREVKRCMDIGKRHPGFFIAVGNHIPSNTPVENCLYYNDCVRELGKR